jgi:hypothetical protein
MYEEDRRRMGISFAEPASLSSRRIGLRMALLRRNGSRLDLHLRSLKRIVSSQYDYLLYFGLLLQAPGIQVEFDIETEETGKLKCVNVTLPGGAPIQPSALPRRPRGGEGGDNAENGENTTPAEPKAPNNNRREKKDNKDKTGGQTNTTTAPPKEKEVPFHKIIAADVKASIETSSGLKLGDNTTTVDISFNNARIKLGQGGYASMALAEGLIAEGTYKCDAAGTVTFTWEHVMKCQGDAWVGGSPDGILSSFALTDGTLLLLLLLNGLLVGSIIYL